MSARETLAISLIVVILFAGGLFTAKTIADDRADAQAGVVYVEGELAAPSVAPRRPCVGQVQYGWKWYWIGVWVPFPNYYCPGSSW